MTVRALVVLLLLRASTAMADEALSPELLQKLAAHAARMERIADTSIATITSDVNERDSHGKVLHVIHTVAHVEKVRGKQVTRIVSATRDGQDYRADAQKQADEQDRKGKKPESPFAPSSQTNYRYTVLGADSHDPKLLRIAVGPRDDDHVSPDVLVGEALIDPATGECVRLAGHASKNPFLVERSDVAFEYDTITPTGRMLSGMTFDFAGGLPLMRRQGDGRVKFEYSPRP